MARRSLSAPAPIPAPAPMPPPLDLTQVRKAIDRLHRDRDRWRDIRHAGPAAKINMAGFGCPWMDTPGGLSAETLQAFETFACHAEADALRAYQEAERLLLTAIGALGPKPWTHTAVVVDDTLVIAAWAVDRRRDQRTIPAEPSERDMIGFDGERFDRPVMFARVGDVAGLG